MNQAEIQKVLEQPFDWFVGDDKMVVVRFDAEEKSAGGIIIPDTAQEKPHKGIIIALGPDITRDEQTGLRKAFCHYHVGDMVIYGKYAGSELTLDIGEVKNVEVMLMRITDYLIGRQYLSNGK